MFLDFCRADNLHTLATLALFVDAHRGGYELSEVLVGSNHIDIQPTGCRLVGEGADNIVGLIVGHLQNGDAHRPQNILNVGHGGDDILGCFAAVGLVVGKEAIAEIAPLGVKSHAEVVGTFVDDDVPQKLCKPKDGRGVQPLTIAHRAARKGVICPENLCVGINKE